MPRAVSLTSGITGRFFQSSGAGGTRLGETDADADSPVEDGTRFMVEGVMDGFVSPDRFVSPTSPFEELVGTLFVETGGRVWLSRAGTELLAGV